MRQGIVGLKRQRRVDLFAHAPRQAFADRLDDAVLEITAAFDNVLREVKSVLPMAPA
jgi:hypothetical protein|tara:strand:+ start:435 stop:605 length:171 start_codon:yes stop_codon:yes gene_type:complete